MPKERQTCTQCSMRRQKCDRNLPCGRCIKRGEADKCTREWPKEGYDPKKHRTYPRHDKDGENELEHSPNHASTATPRSFNSDHHGTHSMSPTPSTFLQQNHKSNGPGNASNQRFDPGPSDSRDDNLSDFLKWGRQNLLEYQIKPFGLAKGAVPIDSIARDPAVAEWEYSNGFGNSNSAQISFLQLLLPNRAQISQMVDYHLRCILWQHNSFHGPTFQDELKQLFGRPMGLQIRDMDLRWTALLFAIMAASMACAKDHVSSSWGFQKVEKAKLTRQWYKAALSCLNLADYMWRHHIHSVQAICTLTSSAHVLGFSNTQSTLLGAALKIAQGLGLQRLSLEQDETPETPMQEYTPAQRERAVRRETGRRLWAQICNQDWFSIPFSDMYSIQRQHFTSLPPQNVDDQTLLPVPEHMPTYSSFSRVLHEIAALMPQVHDAISSANTLYTKYEHVLDYDTKMRNLATDGLPMYFSEKTDVQSDWPEFVPWARRSLRTCFAHKIIMIHRSFLGRSFSDSTFEYTRRASMDAAKIILAEVSDAYNDDGPNLWLDQAFMVAAGITLSLDIFHRKENDVEVAEHRKLVERSISMLNKHENSMIAQRGVRLLSSLLTEQARLMASQSIDNYNRKRARQGSTEEMANDPLSQNPPHFTHVGPSGNKRQKQKFDVPGFVERVVGQDDSFMNALRSTRKGQESTSTTTDLFDPAMSTTGNGNNPDLQLGSGSLGNVLAPQSNRSNPVQYGTKESLQEQMQFPYVDLGYETFEQIFPPHAGMDNSFLFEDLLNFEL